MDADTGKFSWLDVNAFRDQVVAFLREAGVFELADGWVGKELSGEPLTAGSSHNRINRRFYAVEIAHKPGFVFRLRREVEPHINRITPVTFSVSDFPDRLVNAVRALSEERVRYLSAHIAGRLKAAPGQKKFLRSDSLEERRLGLILCMHEAGLLWAARAAQAQRIASMVAEWVAQGKPEPPPWSSGADS